KETYYPDRSYALLIREAESAGIPPAAVPALRRFVAERRADVKRQDAIGALERCARSPESFRCPIPDGEKGPAFVMGRLSYRRFPSPSGPVPGAELLRALTQRPERWAALRAELVTRWFLLHWARGRKIACPEEVSALFAARWEQAHGVTDRRA